MKTTALFSTILGKKWWGLSLVGLLLLAGCQRDEDIEPELRGPLNQSSQVPLVWNELLLDLERFTPGYRPPVSARTAGYVGLAAYEAVQPGMADHYNSLADQFAGLDLPPAEADAEYHWPTVATAVYGRSMELFFPTAPAELLYRIYVLRDEQFRQQRAAVPREVYHRSEARGREVADAVFA